jgi:hypothetical protein
LIKFMPLIFCGYWRRPYYLVRYRGVNGVHGTRAGAASGAVGALLVAMQGKRTAWL